MRVRLFQLLAGRCGHGKALKKFQARQRAAHHLYKAKLLGIHAVTDYRDYRPKQARAETTEINGERETAERERERPEEIRSDRIIHQMSFQPRRIQDLLEQGHD